MRCTHIKQNGEQCGIVVGVIDGLCMWHDPNRTEEARAVARAGGFKAGEYRRARKAAREAERGFVRVPPKPRTLDQAVKFSAWAIHAAATGQIDGDLNRSIQYGVSVFKSTIEKRDLEARCRQLEKKLQQLMKEKQA